MPNLFVLLTHIAHLGEYGGVEISEETSELRYLLLFGFLQRILHEPRLVLDVFERQGEIGFDLLQALGNGVEETSLHGWRSSGGA